MNEILQSSWTSTMQLKYVNEIYTCTLKINNMSTALKQSHTAPVQLQNHLGMLLQKTGTDYYADEIASKWLMTY